MINCIVQDQYGFMWFATKDGLNCYDGYRFTVYRHNPADPNTLLDNYVESVFEDSNGRLWVGTTSQGLELFHRETETFSHFNDNVTGTRLRHVTAITEDRLGRLWLTTENGVVVMNEEKGGGFRYRKFTNQVSYVFGAPDGSVWVSEEKGWLLHIRFGNSGKEIIDSFSTRQYWPKELTTGAIESYFRAFVSDTVQHCLYLFNKHAIVKYSEKQKRFTTLLANLSGIGTFSRSAAITGQTIWLVYYFRLQRLDLGKPELSPTEGTTEDTRRLAGYISFVYTDRSGIVWVGTKGYGLLKYNPALEKFHHTDNSSIHWMNPTRDGRVMVIKDDAKRLYFFDKSEGRYTRILPDTTGATRNTALLKHFLEAAIEDDEGHYWLFRYRLMKYEAATQKFLRYPDKRSFPFYKDGNGNIWFGNMQSLCCYRNGANTFTDYPYPITVQHYPYEFLQAIHQDSKGIFWLGTTAGLLRFDPKKRHWQHFTNQSADTASLSFNLIFSVCPDPLAPDRYLWIGTNGGGLNRFDTETGKVVRYTAKQGLANDVVYGILSDAEGNLWMSTNNGLSKFAKDRKIFHAYNKNDGLQDNEFNRNAFCKTPDGILFFGGVNGFNYFNPTELKPNSVIPNILITGFKISNQPVSFQSSHSPLSKPVYLTDKIVLPYKDNIISFDFVSLDYVNPDKNLYKYKLEGFNKQWVHAGTENSVTYTNLDPGTYTLKVKGSNSDGIWNENGRSLRLVILPPWYMTWWFRATVAILIISAAYAFYRYRLTQAHRLQAVRNRIASDLHDEIGSNLSNISIFSDVAQKKLESHTGETVVLLKKISDHARTSMEAMSDIVWMINARNDRFENIIIRMRTLAAELFEATGCTLHLHFDERLNHIKLNMEQRKHFYLIYKEAINNIAKYAGCKDVWIEMELKDGEIALLIKDNGQGFDTLNDKKGNGLFNMRKRADALKGKLNITSQTGKGTAVEFRFKNVFF